MKKVFLTVLVVLMATTLTFAHAALTRRERKEAKNEKTEARKEIRKERRAENREVSDATRNNFAGDFPRARNPLFARTKQFEVYFLSGKKSLKAYYDFNSDLVGTTQNKSFADIPARAQKEIRKYYPGYTASNVILFDDNESNPTDMSLFETPFQDVDNYFVELKKDNKTTIVKVSMDGDVSFFKSLKKG